jgi:hypothetical protein
VGRAVGSGLAEGSGLEVGSTPVVARGVAVPGPAPGVSVGDDALHATTKLPNNEMSNTMDRIRYICFIFRLTKVCDFAR